MPTYKVNEAGVRNAERLIRDRQVDSTSDWQEAQPSADDENRFVEAHGYDAFGEWHLAIDPTAGEEAKGRYAFPFGDFSKLHRDGLTSAKQRAAQHDHPEIADAADALIAKLDE